LSRNVHPHKLICGGELFNPTTDREETAMARGYYWHNIHTLLAQTTSNKDLRIFCDSQPGFENIYDHLPETINKTDLIDRVVQTAQDTSSVDTLLSWAKKTYPIPFEDHQPYTFDIDDDGDLLRQEPYRGLAVFREEHAPFFFGRDTFNQKMTEAVRKRDLVAIMGPSGSGKSSVIFAGLVPRLRRQGDWTIAEFRPGRNPFQTLAAALLPLVTYNLTDIDRLIETRKLTEALRGQTLPLRDVIDQIQQNQPPQNHLLLIADQFEELYTLCPDLETRRRFLDLLLTVINLTEDEKDPFITLVLSLRADFLGEALSHRPFADVLQDTDMKLGPMTQAELKAAIEKPALTQGVIFEAGLVERILSDVGDEPGHLPLLEFALTELWQQRTRGQLTHAAYEAIGQVSGALTHYADQVFDDLSETRQAQARRIFIQLVHPGAGAEDTRRLTTQAELGPDDWALVQKLADARLVVTNRDVNGEETVEVVHEALIWGWGKLKTWMAEDRAFRAWQERLRVILRQWEANNRDPDGLLRGGPLAEAEGWLTERENDLSQAERNFIRAGLAQRQRGQRLRNLALVGAVAVAIIIAFLSIFSVTQTQQLVKKAGTATYALAEAQKQAATATYALGQAEQQAATATYALGAVAEEANKVQQQAATATYALGEAAGQAATAQVERDRAATAEANAIQQKIIAEQQTNIALSRQLAAQAQSLLTQNPQLAMLLALEGQAIAPTDETANIIGVVPYNYPPLKTTLTGHDDSVLSVAWSPDGNRLASSSVDQTITIWDVSNGQALTTLQGHTASVLSVAWSPDGNRLASGSLDQRVIIWDVASGQALTTLQGHTASVLSVAWSPDGNRLASGSLDGTVIIWDVASGQALTTLQGHTASVWSVAWSPDGNRLASGSVDQTVMIWDIASGRALTTLRGHSASVSSVAWSPDGSQLASGSSDRTVIVWNVANGQGLATLRGHTDWVRSIAWSPDGGQLASASLDQTIIVWDVSSSQALTTLRGHTDSVWSVAWSPDGSQLASGSVDRTVIIWDISSGRASTILQGHTDSIASVAWSPDGTRLASGSADRTAVVWNVATGQALTTLRGHTDSVWSVAWSPDGNRLASGSLDGTVIIWNVSTGQALTTLRGHTDWVLSVAWSPDGSRLASSSVDGTVIIWNVATGQALTTLRGHTASVSSVAWNPDSSQLASGSIDRTVMVWDVASGQALTTLRGHTDSVWSVAWSPDGSQLASSSSDQTVIIWDMASGQTLTTLQGHTASVWSVAWSPDGGQLASGSDDQTVMIWDVASGQALTTLRGHTDSVWRVAWSPDGNWLASSSSDRTILLLKTRFIRPPCQLVSRNLTPAEWKRYLPEALPYRATCPNYSTAN
jgi:WD40 repeat protein